MDLIRHVNDRPPSFVLIIGHVAFSWVTVLLAPAENNAPSGWSDQTGRKRNGVLGNTHNPPTEQKKEEEKLKYDRPPPYWDMMIFEMRQRIIIVYMLMITTKTHILEW